MTTEVQLAFLKHISIKIHQTILMLNHQYFKKKAEQNKASFYDCDFSCTIDKGTSVQCRYICQCKYNSVKLLRILDISLWGEILLSHWEDLAKPKPLKKP